MEEERQEPCPVEITLGVISGKWKAVILFHLFDAGAHRFAELRRKIPAISDRVLTRQLRDLERDGVIERQVFAEVPPRVEYSPTAYGRTLQPVTQAMCEWGEAHAERADDPSE